MITLNATHQQTKRLVDAVAGTYQTVLTIDRSVGHSGIVGTYNCTVGNVRGESSEVVVVPGMNSFTLIYILTSFLLNFHITAEMHIHRIALNFHGSLIS